MHKKIAKLDRDFHKFLALLGLTTQLRPSPSIEDADKARPSARQWRARGAAASPEPSSEADAGRGRRAAAFDACARAARPVLQQLAGMSDDRARLAQALLDAIPE